MVAMLSLWAMLTALQGQAQCVGDCNSDGHVTVDEIIAGVSIALGNSALDSCPSFDADGSGQVTIDELIQSINLALGSCPATPTPTPTERHTPTVTPTFVPGTCFDPSVHASEPLCELDVNPRPCDFLVPEYCLFPYPSSFFLREDPTTPTGYRVNYAREAMPANRRPLHVDPKEWNTLDGFSPGAMMLALFPQGVDLQASGAAPITNFARSLEADSPTVLIDADSGERILHFAEMDAKATSEATRALIVRPAIRLKETHRYIFAVRGLKDLDGGDIPPGRAFRILRDRETTPVAAIEARRAHFEDIFNRLAAADVERSNLILAWDFVVASSESITGRALAARDQALEFNGPGAPPFQVTAVDDNYSDQIFRRVRGTYTVPLFMDRPNPPAVYNLDDNGVPRQNGTTTAPFTVIIPRSAVEGAQPIPGRPMVYGHGLLGSGQGEVTAGPQQSLASRFGFIIAATDWIGLSSGDVENTLRLIGDISRFNQLADRLQQGFINFILLGRLMISENGFNSHEAFRFNGVPIIDTQELYYNGNSQGGIEGGAYLALSPDTTRGVLGVGAANYSFLLQRSIDFDNFNVVFEQAYTSELDRTVLFALLQQLWDRGEPNGYTSRLIENPLPNTRPKKILIQNGINDSQVSHVATEIQARSLGIPAVAPSAYPAFGIQEREAPFDGSAWVPYDVGGSAVPLTNTAPSFENGVHEAVRRLDAAQRQIDAFLRPDGVVRNFCPGACVFEVPGVR
jgi:hypothetical protein